MALSQQCLDLNFAFIKNKTNYDKLVLIEFITQTINQIDLLLRHCHSNVAKKFRIKFCIFLKYKLMINLFW